MTGNLPGTLQLLDLRLAVAYADSAPALALASLHKSGSTDAGTSPVLRSGFVKGLAAQMDYLWQQLEFVGPEACASHGAMLQYLQSGQLPKQLPHSGVSAAVATLLPGIASDEPAYSCMQSGNSNTAKQACSRQV